MPTLAAEVQSSEIIVIGKVEADPERPGLARLLPESFLKGPARTDPLLLEISPDATDGTCPNAEFVPGERVLAMLGGGIPAGRWPGAQHLYHLRDGTAVPDAGGKTVSEENLVVVIRDLTGQYAVPAADKTSGAGIDWAGTVLPVGGTLLAVFVLGLVLMRYWHRIDPT